MKKSKFGDSPSIAPKNNVIYYCCAGKKDTRELTEGHWFIDNACCQMGEIIECDGRFVLSLSVQMANKPHIVGDRVSYETVEECIKVVSQYYESKVVTITAKELAKWVRESLKRE